MRGADDTIKLSKERLNTAENLVEDGNKLLKQCLNKMNHGIFLDGQWVKNKKKNWMRN